MVWYGIIADTKVLAKVLCYGLVWFDRFGIIWFARFAMFAIIWFAIGLVWFGIRLLSFWYGLVDRDINGDVTRNPSTGPAHVRTTLWLVRLKVQVGEHRPTPLVR